MVARSRISLPVVLFAAFAASGAARANEPTLDGYVAEVIARNPSLRARTLRRGAFREEAKAASAFPDPSLSVMFDRFPMGAEMPMIRYQVSQMIPWPGKLDLMRDAVERQGDAAGADVDARRLELRLEAKRGWYGAHQRLRPAPRAARSGRGRRRGQAHRRADVGRAGLAHPAHPPGRAGGVRDLAELPAPAPGADVIER
jgi:cobalt-zinc-cadmium efflux system outer membrane protein